MGKHRIRTRLVLALYFISLVVSIFIFSAFMSSAALHVEYNSYRQCAVDGSRVYFIHNQNGKNYIFAIQKNAEVSDLYCSPNAHESRLLAISAFNGNVFVVEKAAVTKKDEQTDDVKTAPGYRILRLDDKLRIDSGTSYFEIDEGYIISGFSAEKSGLFLTLLSEDGATLKVICVDPACLKETPDDSATLDGDVKTEVISSIKADDNRFIADAIYADGQLYTRLDNSKPAGVFEKDPSVMRLISGMKLSGRQKISIYLGYLIRYATALIIWFIILFPVIRMFENRNRSFYYLCIAEAVLFVIAGVATLTVARFYQISRELEHSRFAIYSLQALTDEAGLDEKTDYEDTSFYDTQRYQDIRKALTSFVKRKGNNNIFYDVMLVRLKDNLVCAGVTGRNISVLSNTYGNELLGLPGELHRGQSFALCDFTMEGQPYRAVAVANKEPAPDCALIGIIGTNSNDKSVVADNMGVYILFLAIFAVASLMVILVWLLHMKDLAALEQVLNDTALGNDIRERPVTLGNDVKDMWDAVSEIRKKFDSLKHSKLKIMEAYYRFAPKNIELIMGKDSIVEVHNGDKRTFDGTIGFIRINAEYKNRQKKLDSVISAIGEYADKNKAMLIGKDVDISNLQMVISDKQTDIIKSLVEIYTNHAAGREQSLTTMFLYRTTFTFCIVGNDRESSFYLSYDYYNDKEQLSNIVSFIDAMDLGLVVSKWVQDRDKYDGNLRFIGYGGVVGNNNEIALYEVLDADDEKQRAEKLATLDRFNKALKLYLDKDFYLARNMFSEILRETPSDKLVRWYVFESEKYLNEGTAEGNEYKYFHL
ncbi:MAG: hypothetical protein J5802_07895 [Butyrivibrio sp.]|nr:hypothetical protein [Butyrivibrio sp.]